MGGILLFFDTQVPLINKTRNYHINVRHAFDTALALKNFLNDDVSGEVTLAAHSLGNMVASAMLTDYADGWDASRKIKNYFMLDAAVAAEAYGSRDDNNYVEMNKDAVTNVNMTHPDWKDYENRLWSSEWHLLFDTSDNRSKLTWRNIFAQRPLNVMYYNFFSSGEDVLDEHIGVPQEPDILTDGIGRYAWALQEKLKGGTLFNGILGSDYGGWGFNLIDDAYRIELAGKSYPIYPVDANKIGKAQLRTRPFFSKGADDQLFTEAGGSNYAAQYRFRLLADAIPARTLATGKKEVEKLTINGENHNMQDEFKTTNKAGIYWPRQDQRWLHNDVREVAYSYIYSIFDAITIQGGLR